ncbi:hypothetical protein ACAG39_03840 [Caldicellulosiruptoraceae bacterium PP1]
MHSYPNHTIKRAFSEWWDKKSKKPLIQITYPDKDIPDEQLDYPGWAFVRYKDNPQKAIDAHIKWFEKYASLGEGYNDIWINLGAGVVAAYYTDYLHFNGDTVWFEYPLDWDKVEKLLLRDIEQSVWWNYTKNATELACNNMKENFTVGITDLGGILDILASLRGTQNLLYDIIDCPERVNEAQNRILEIWHYCYDKLYSILNKYQEGTSAWMWLWCPKRWYPIQCDFSAMISPKMFEKFVAPYLKEQARRLDYTIFHLDGPGELPHLDILLDIDEITGIQWVPGAGEEPVDSPKWFDLYRKIQEKGKLLVLNGVFPEYLERLFDNIDTKGVIISTYCETKKEALDILEWRERL